MAMNRIDSLRRAAGTAVAASVQAAQLSAEFDRVRAQVGAAEAARVRGLSPDRVADAEFQVFSQFGEDGILQFLVGHVPVPVESEVFVEFGVESYAEANTRFLLVHDNWRGLIMDGGDAMHTLLESTGMRWRHHIDAKTAFIDRDNINSLIAEAGIEGDIGLLSVDIDGNDYWVLQAIDVVSPRLLALEYNATFGPEAAVTVPYDPGFVRGEKHWTWLYWGASLAALTRVANERGYALVAGNRAGNNAFYVRRDVLGEIPERTVEEVWRPARFRESRGRDGSLTYISDPEERLRLMADMPVVDVETGAEITIGERLGV
jgi:hypothetical protein